MRTIRARVRNGRLVVDEPTQLPEGSEVELVPADDIDDLEPAERAKLYGFLADSIRSHVPGQPDVHRRAQGAAHPRQR